MINITRTGAIALAVLVAACQPTGEPAAPKAAGARVVAASDVEAGRYLVMIGGCNDCHTPAYARTNGAQPPESEWLKGSSEPHTGPWGTSYGRNLRLTAARLTEDQWVEGLNTGTSLPPMPWPSVRAMAEADKRAIYRYIRSLPGDPGQPAPEPLPPGATPPTPAA
jgi:mono/diheme cytochrome c family protein